MEEDIVKVIEQITERIQEHSQILSRLTTIAEIMSKKLAELRTDVDKLIENGGK